MAQKKKTKKGKTVREVGEMSVYLIYITKSRWLISHFK